MGMLVADVVEWVVYIPGVLVPHKPMDEIMGYDGEKERRHHGQGKDLSQESSFHQQ